MACRKPDVMRRHQRASDDDVYMIDVAELFETLSTSEQRNVGRMLSTDDQPDWHRIADDLKLSKDNIERIEALPCDTRGCEMLKSWMKTPEESTIAVLRNILCERSRNDVVRQLDKARLDVGILTVHVYTNGTRHELSTKCPGLKPLVEQVRPLLYRKIAANILLQDPKIVFRLQVTNKEDRKWTSPSKNFWGSQIVIEMVEKSQNKGRQSEPTPHCQRVDDDKRSCISWIDDDLIVFADDSLTQQEDAAVAEHASEIVVSRTAEVSNDCSIALHSDFGGQRPRAQLNDVGADACGPSSTTVVAVEEEGH